MRIEDVARGLHSARRRRRQERRRIQRWPVHDVCRRYQRRHPAHRECEPGEDAAVAVRRVEESPLAVTAEEQQEVRRLIEAHEHTLQVCRACAETTRDLAWEVKRGNVPSPEALTATLAEVERVLDDIGKVEIAIAEMKAALW